MVIELHKLSDLFFQISGQKIILQVHNILHGTVVALDLALGHGMIGSTAGMLDMPALQEGAQALGHVTGTIVRK